MSSINAFISGQSVVTSFGEHVPNNNADLSERTSDLVDRYRDYVAYRGYDVEENATGGDRHRRSSSTVSPNNTGTASSFDDDDDDDDDDDGDDDHHGDSHRRYRYSRVRIGRVSKSVGIFVLIAMAIVIMASTTHGRRRGDGQTSAAALAGEEEKDTEYVAMPSEQGGGGDRMEGSEGNDVVDGVSGGYDSESGVDTHEDDNDGADATTGGGKNDDDDDDDDEDGVSYSTTNTNTNIQEVEEDFDTTYGLVKETLVPIVEPGPDEQQGMEDAWEANVIANTVQGADDEGGGGTFVPVIEPGPEYYTENEVEGVEEDTSPSTHQHDQSTLDNTVLLLHEQFKPMWLSSAEGWNGGSYSDAVSFCNSVRGKQLCPYSVMCPRGPGRAVMGGLRSLEFKVNGEQYAPVSGGKNHWVMVGDYAGTHVNDDGTVDEEDGGIVTATTTRCMTYRQLEGKNPDWGLNGDRSDVKRHIMCCTVN